MHTLKKKTDILVAGAGIAGCAAAQELQDKEADYLLVEKNAEPGGLTRSISIGEAHFDYTGHYLHLAKFKSPAELPYAKQNNQDWRLIKRRSSVYMDGKLVPSPLQYNLYYVPGTKRERCITGFRNRPKIEKPSSFKEYLLSGFGHDICECFLLPYNEKIMACSLDKLSIDSVTRFFPAPDPEMIEKGYAREGANNDTGYNASFWYPARQGIGLLASGLASGLNSIQTCCPIEKIDISSKKVYTPLGEILYNRMLISLPLKRLCELTGDPYLLGLASALRHTRVFCLNLLVRCPAPECLGDSQWIYIPDKEMPFYRIGIYSHISSEMNPRDVSALYVETSVPDDQPLPVMTVLLDEIFLHLDRLGWVKREDCITISANWIGFAYVLFDHHRNINVNKIMDILKSHDIYPIGRYGLWDYISMEDTIISGIETARKFI